MEGVSLKKFILHFIVIVFIMSLVFPLGTVGIVEAADHCDTTNNIVLFIAYSDKSFTSGLSLYESMYNTGEKSVKSYYDEISYGQFEINSYFPGQSGEIIKPYIDPHPAGYYHSYNEVSNPEGYISDGWDRVRTLTQNALVFYKDAIEELAIDLDYNDDGIIDSVTRIHVNAGMSDGWSTPISSYAEGYKNGIKINGMTDAEGFITTESFYLSDDQVRTACHELFHALFKAPDLYSYIIGPAAFSPLLSWDIMSSWGYGHMGAHMKEKYAEWITIPEITSAGHYSLEPLASSKNCAYKIISPYSDDEYFVVEYRKKIGLYEGRLPNEGLLVTRINKSVTGNSNGMDETDVEVYAIRGSHPEYEIGDIVNAPLTSDRNFTTMGEDTDPTLSLSDRNFSGITISNVGTCGDTIEFDVSYSTPKISKPVFSPDPSKFYSTPQQVSISSPAENMEVYYTTDGTTPSVNSTRYTEPIEINTVTKLRAIAHKDGKFSANSAVFYVSEFPESQHPYTRGTDFTWDYTIPGASSLKIKFDNVQIYSGYEFPEGNREDTDKIIITDAQNRIIENTTPKAFNRYYFTQWELDGKTLSVQGDTVHIRLVGALPKSSRETGGWGMKVDEIIGFCENPVFDLPGGAYYTPQVVNISHPNPNAVIRFTTDGSEPSDTSQIYTEGLKISTPTNIKAKAYIDGLYCETVSLFYYVSEFPESLHNYQSNVDYTWEYQIPDAAALQVDFDYCDLYWCDLIFIYDKHGNINGIYTSDDLSHKTITVPGDTVRIRLVGNPESGDQRLRYGFKVNNITAVDAVSPSDLTLAKIVPNLENSVSAYLVHARNDVKFYVKADDDINLDKWAVFIVQYDDSGRLCEIEAAQRYSASDGYYLFRGTKPQGNYKVMFWNLENLAPICKVIE